MAWDDPAADFSRASLTLLRSTWNYPQHVAAFAAWARRASNESSLWNPLPVVEWNLHKRYLLQLEARGIAVAPTELVLEGSPRTLDSILERRGWDDVVIKPAISAASFRTIRTHRDAADDGERHLRELAASGDVLVQAYLPSVEDHGERALVWIDGALTHAVRKSPRFAGEEESVSDSLPISDSEAELARRAVASVGHELLYARIDVAPGPEGTPVLMELELIEPSLFFVQAPVALERLVAGVRQRLLGEHRPSR